MGQNSEWQLERIRDVEPDDLELAGLPDVYITRCTRP